MHAYLPRALAFAILSTLATAADWPQFRGPGGTATSADKGTPVTWSGTSSIVWKTELPGAGTSSAIAVGPRIFLTAYSGWNVPGQPGGSQEELKREVLCLNRSNGKILWKADMPSKLPEQDRIRDGHGYASSTPACDGQRVYVFFGKSGVFALDLNGKVLWKADVGEGLNGWGSAASPVLHGNLLFINASVESESLIALDKNTGKEVWRARGIKESWNTPVVVATPAGKAELVVAIFGKVLGFDPEKGTQLWSCETKIPWYMVPSLVAEKGIVYCIGGRNGGGALAIKAGGRGDVEPLWRGRKGSNVSSPVLHEGHLYWASDSQPIVTCTNATTGEMIYEERLQRAEQFYPSPVLADGKLYYLTRAGQVFVVAAKPKFELLATNKFDERAVFNACPAIADSRLLIRSDRWLYCVGK
ncbi:serine/threonine protein kinase [Verrucomicrobiota bacterium]|nr:serine/threonine protein kinase [Verrucomicrobiota bacterium]